MMAEYIDREALLKDIKESVVFSGRAGHISPEMRGANKITDRIKSAPTAYVVEVKHGEWIDTGDEILDTTYSGWKCSECGYVFCGNKFKFCPECGAKMDVSKMKIITGGGKAR